jgi:hypothetical protein
MIGFLGLDVKNRGAKISLWIFLPEAHQQGYALVVMEFHTTPNFLKRVVSNGFCKCYQLANENRNDFL